MFAWIHHAQEAVVGMTLAVTRRPRSSPRERMLPDSQEASVQITTHPLSDRLQIHYHAHRFDAVLLDPANPPLREGETVYLIRLDAHRAWVSRVRSTASQLPIERHATSNESH